MAGRTGESEQIPDPVSYCFQQPLRSGCGPADSGMVIRTEPFRTDIIDLTHMVGPDIEGTAEFAQHLSVGAVPSGNEDYDIMAESELGQFLVTSRNLLTDSVMDTEQTFPAEHLA